MGLSLGLKPKGTKRPRPPRGLFADLAVHTRRRGPVLANSYRFASGSDAVQGQLSRSVSGLFRWTWPPADRRLFRPKIEKRTSAIAFPRSRQSTDPGHATISADSQVHSNSRGDPLHGIHPVSICLKIKVCLTIWRHDLPVPHPPCAPHTCGIK